MKQNYTHVSILLDRSGSMISIKNDVIGGFNTLLQDQLKVDGKMTLSLAQFDTQFEMVYDMKDIKSVSPLTAESFVPRGSTALLDSAAQLIEKTGQALAILPESERPSKVLFVMITDGEENASRKITNLALTQMIEHQEKIYNWQFSYIGANQDAFSVGAAIGLRSNAVDFSADSIGTGKLFKAMSASMSSYRTAAPDALYSITKEDIDKA